MNVFVVERAIEAARAVLGAMLIDPETIGAVLHQLTVEDFLDPQLQAVFLAIKRLRSEGRPVDALIVNDILGGTASQLLADLINETVTAANVGEYVPLCHKYALEYRLDDLNAQMTDALDLETKYAILDRMNALQCRKPGVRITDLAQCYSDFLDRHAKGKQAPYLTWGIPALDDRVFVEAGDFIVLGGYPSAGKTALALQMAVHIARDKLVGYFYYENNDKKLFDRLVSLQTKVSFGRIKRFDLNEADYSQIVKTQGLLTAPKLEFIDASGMTTADLRATALSRHYRVVIVDYLQKLPASRERRNVSDFERVSQISSDLQNLGKQTGVTVLALSQLSRPEKGSKAHPGMHSFRQSGQIEQDADVAFLLFREKEEDSGSTARILKIGKNKEGEADLSLRMHFDGDTQTFSRIFPQPAPPEKKKSAQVDFWEDLEEISGDDNPFE